MGPEHVEVGSEAGVATRPIPPVRRVPWQIWVVVVLLAVEGLLSNLPLIPKAPVAAVWLGAKCLFIVGLLRGWRWMFVVFLLAAAVHTLFFATRAPIIALINLVLLLLVASALRFYFPRAGDGPAVGAGATSWGKDGVAEQD